MKILTVERGGVVVQMTEREYRIAFEAIRSQELLDREEADAQEAGRVEQEESNVYWDGTAWVC